MRRKQARRKNTHDDEFLLVILKFMRDLFRKPLACNFFPILFLLLHFISNGSSKAPHPQTHTKYILPYSVAVAEALGEYSHKILAVYWDLTSDVSCEKGKREFICTNTSIVHIHYITLCSSCFASINLNNTEKKANPFNAVCACECIACSIQSDMVYFEMLVNREIDANGPFDAESERTKIIVTIEICRAERATLERRRK